MNSSIGSAANTNRARAITIYVVEDDPNDRAALELQLRREGFAVRTFPTGESFLDTAGQEPPDLALVDIVMPGLSGIETLARFNQIQPDIPVILLTGQGTVENAFQAMRHGAYDFIPKPFEMARLNVSIHNALRTQDLTREVHKLQRELRTHFDFQNLIGASPSINRLFADLEKLADSDLPVLVQGESGTGKELVARTIHYNSRRGEGPFLIVNCSELRQNLIESSLFGSTSPGGSTGSRKSGGKWLRADGGTLYLNGIDEISLALQEELLTHIRNHRLLSSASEGHLIDVRLISSARKDLNEEIAQGRFNTELINYLAPFQIKLPPLRERKEDIPLLAKRFLSEYAEQTGRSAPALSPETLATLTSYPWPGNIRELKNIIRQTLILSESDTICVEDLPPSIRETSTQSGETIGMGPLETPISSIKTVEEQMIRTTLDKTGGDVTRTASILGISRATLYRRLKTFQISRRKS